MEEGGGLQWWNSRGSRAVYFIIGVTIVPRKGAGLGVQIERGDRWRCQGEQGSSENWWVGSSKYCNERHFLADLCKSTLDPHENKSNYSPHRSSCDCYG